MKKIAIALALSAMFSTAFAGNGNGNHGNGNGGSQGAVSGSAQIGGEYTIGTISGSVSANSNISGNAVSASRINGNGFSSQTTTSIGNGSATGSLGITPTSVTASTSQTGYSNVVSSGVTKGNAPAVDSAGLIVNGTAGLSSVTNTAAANVSQTFTGHTGYLGIEGSAGYAGTGAFSGL